MFKSTFIIGLLALFLAACSSNKNSLRINGQRCQNDFKPVVINLQQHEGEDLTPEQKADNKLFKEKKIESVESIDFDGLPNGIYKRRRIEFYIVENEKRGALHKGGLEIFAFRRDATEGEQKKYNRDYMDEFGCLRNMPHPDDMKAGIFYEVEGIVEIAKITEGKTRLKTLGFAIENKGQLDSKWELSDSGTPEEVEQKPTEYFKGDSDEAPEQSASLYKIKDNKTETNIYELHSEYAGEGFTVQIKTIFQWQAAE